MAEFNGTPLAERLKAIGEERGGTIPVSELGRVVGDLFSTLSGDLTPRSLAVAQEIQSLVGVLEQMHREIASISPNIAGEQIPIAQDQLQAVIRDTEEATGVFLDSGEQLEQIADELDAPMAERVRAIVTRIYEASNFQDVTGQRISKVISTLMVIEAKVASLASLVDGDAESRPPAAPVQDQALLNGPQLHDAAASQDDIDRLFASL